MLFKQAPACTEFNLALFFIDSEIVENPLSILCMKFDFSSS
jgi:hypothetical protein